MSIPGVPFEDMDPAMRRRAEAAAELTGDTRFIRAIAPAPHMADFYFGNFYEQVFFGGDVPIVTKELVRLRLSNLHGCAFRNRTDPVSARRQGVTEEQIAAVAGDIQSGPFTDAEKAALALATLLSNAVQDGVVDEELAAEFRCHYTDGQIMELAMVIAILVGMARLLFAFDLADREQACPVGGSPGSQSKVN